MKKTSMTMAIMAICLFASTASAKKAFSPLDHQTIQSMACVDRSNTNEIEFLNCDGSGNLVVNSIPAAGFSPTNGIVDIPDAGATDRTQMSSLAASSCTIQAPLANSGDIYVGGPTVTNASGTNEGINLSPGSSIGNVFVSDLDELFVSADVANDDAKFLCN